MPADHDAVAELLGAYALDAVDPSEAEIIEGHLLECPRCRDELVGHREVAAALALGGATAPEGLWARVAANLGATPDEPEVARLYPLERRHRGVSFRMAAAVAAVAAALIVGLGLQVRSQDRQINQIKSAQAASALDAAFSSAMLDQSASKVSLVSDNGHVRVDAVLQPNGDGFLAGKALPALASNHTYQLWGILGDRSLSLGVLGSHPNVVPFRASTPVVALAVTDEVVPGVVASQQKPVVVGYIRATGRPTGTA